MLLYFIIKKNKKATLTTNTITGKRPLPFLTYIKKCSADLSSDYIIIIFIFFDGYSTQRRRVTFLETSEPFATLKMTCSAKSIIEVISVHFSHTSEIINMSSNVFIGDRMISILKYSFNNQMKNIWNDMNPLLHFYLNNLPFLEYHRGFGDVVPRFWIDCFVDIVPVNFTLGIHLADNFLRTAHSLLYFLLSLTRNCSSEFVNGGFL